MKRPVMAAVLLAAILASATPAIAQQPTAIGGLAGAEYCQSKGFIGVTLTKDRVGPNAARNNWRCVEEDGDLRPYSFVQACQWQYGRRAVFAQPTNPDDAYTWTCYAAGNPQRR